MIVAIKGAGPAPRATWVSGGLVTAGCQSTVRCTCGRRGVGGGVIYIHDYNNRILEPNRIYKRR